MTELEKAFQILDVAPDSSEATIKKAWRALVRSYHPDMAKSDPTAANQRLAEINAAFDAVCNCSPDDIRQLQQAAARKARAQARMKQAKEARRCTANDERERNMTAPDVRRDKARAALPAATALTQVQKVKWAHQRTARRDLSDLAQATFAAARAICTPSLAQAGSSIYL
ncbi:MAG: J domain-containing protein [Pseudomonadota bacterium]